MKPGTLLKVNGDAYRVWDLTQTNCTQPGVLSRGELVIFIKINEYDECYYDIITKLGICSFFELGLNEIR
jgi:hypothetical protein